MNTQDLFGYQAAGDTFDKKKEFDSFNEQDKGVPPSIG